jgi:hypothetical protein
MSKLRPNQFTLPSGAVITEIPLLFSTEMVRANLEDRKTQSRRPRGLKEINYAPELWILVDRVAGIKGGELHFGFGYTIESLEVVKSPYGKPGDLLWFRETWNSIHDAETDQFLKYGYKADWSQGVTSHPKNKGIWSPSIHMPKAASRIWAMVEDIRVERLQDISEEEAKAEGIEKHYSELFKEWRYRDYFDGKRRARAFAQFPEMAKQTGFGSMPWPDWRDPISSFNSLWLSINGRESWDANPWVWVIQYRILSKTGRPDLETIERNYLEVTGKEASRV